jgi:hypothetical protein
VYGTQPASQPAEEEEGRIGDERRWWLCGYNTLFYKEEIGKGYRQFYTVYGQNDILLN